MTDTNSNIPESSDLSPENEPKWDYTSREQNLFIGALTIGLNLLVIIAFALDRTVPAVHAFFTGKPL